MTRRSLATTVAAAFAAACLLPAAAPAAGPAVPAAVPLATGWQKLADPGNEGVGAGYWRPDTRHTWKPAVVPSVITGATTEAAFKGSVEWYRTTFTAPPATAGFTDDVHFEQVRRTAQVWLNGVALGRHEDPYVPFDLPTRGALRPGARNVLVVRVDNRKSSRVREGWWNWGGITRPVSLVPRGALELRDAGVLSDVRCADGGGDCRAAARLDGTLVNRSDHPIAAPRVTLALSDGRTLTRTFAARSLAPGEETHVQFELPVPDAHLWSPQDPHLYGVTVTTSAGDVAQQVDRWRTGLRSVTVEDGMLNLNGRQLQLRGAAVQEDVPGRGPALTDADIAQTVAELKAVHANVTRAHYLLNPKLLDALDAAGIMVWSQAPIYHRDVLLETPAKRDTALATVRGTILQARNHPSVITHSVANELSPVPDTTPGTAAFLAAARSLAASLDPTIPVSVDLLSYPGYARQRAYAAFPLLGINSYFGWYTGKAEHSVAKLSDLGPYLDHMRRLYPTQGLEVTEFGAESTFAGPASEKETYAFQTDYLRRVLAIIEQRPFIGGAIYWTLREFAVKPHWVGGVSRPGVERNSIHHKGLITYDGRRKPAWSLAEHDFASTADYRSVSPAAAAGVADETGGPGRLEALGLALGLLLLLALDGWVIAGVWRRRARARSGRGVAGTRSGQRAEATQEAAGARAA
ncbi:beta galactosidase jelly roll domain-containing protein [Paraconexibacter antarcticus]|uniref:Beta galactosidase jelly roll domain-containing protein n=1 Tax=Paraconexibacter antarcticus TaxID=2949664 RepID=A0ABY5DU91_9ACTN|nr:glycoside hydrolase family 2 TIM barrel-domain containing protein [Paraconexibacter antarcticus]UTI64484.1 beta galactosidase jelly roll domain-containing protein [Paraconexibacter antarcticus]